MSNVFKGKRPMIGDTFIKNQQSWEVAGIAENINVVVAKKHGILQSDSSDDFIIIREEIK